MDDDDLLKIWVKVLSVHETIAVCLDDENLYTSSDDLQVGGRIMGVEPLIRDSFGQSIASASAWIRLVSGRDKRRKDLGTLKVESDASKIRNVSRDDFGDLRSGVIGPISVESQNFSSLRDTLLSNGNQSPQLEFGYRRRREAAPNEEDDWPLCLDVLSFRLNNKLL